MPAEERKGFESPTFIAEMMEAGSHARQQQAQQAAQQAQPNHLHLQLPLHSMVFSEPL